MPALVRPLERHIFICTNERPPDAPKKSCRGSELCAEFKKRLRERGIVDGVRANKSGCLDCCAHGPTIVVYPEAVWYGGVRIEDIDEIIESHVIGGVPVERLRIDR